MNSVSPFVRFGDTRHKKVFVNVYSATGWINNFNCGCQAYPLAFVIKEAALTGHPAKVEFGEFPLSE
jgi:hypothetical protein